jgi:hypothetical protein
VVEELLRIGYKYQLGLEVGSKSELYVGLSIEQSPESLLICNGFKDEGFIEMAFWAEALGKRVVATLTDMDQPLGCAIGNALEVAEAFAAVRGVGPEDLFQECLALGSRMLVLAGVARDACGLWQSTQLILPSGTGIWDFLRNSARCCAWQP